MKFLKVKNKLYNPDFVWKIDCSEIEKLIITIHFISGHSVKVEGLEAIDIAMQARPSIIEGKRFKFKKNMWIVHNLLAHPLMQILAFFRLYKLSLWLHDITIPKPITKKD